jgi:hypothetical protein
MSSAALEAYYDAQKCAQRNRVAARRDGVDAVPIRLLRSAPAAGDSPTLVSARGTLPKNDTDALERINALLPTDSQPLTADDVYIHYAEAANNSFMSDRYMFLDTTTLRNIATDAQAGIAFMNSHRTGSLSHPSEQPFGKTFAGRWERYASDGSKQPHERATLGFYMLRGIRPNGEGGPSTDDLHLMIQGGTTSDASVALGEGMKVCDICANELGSRDCGHAPGTARNLSPEQKDAQTARGVKKGMASYTLVDAHLGEISAVYDGAVPGAGFRKALALAKQGDWTLTELAQARSAYSTLLSKGDFEMMDIEEVQELVEKSAEGALTRALRKIGFSPAPAREPGTTEAAAPVVAATSNNDEVARLRKENEALRAGQEATASKIRQERAAMFGKELVLGAKLYPAEREYMEFVHEQLAILDEFKPAPADAAFSVASTKSTTRVGILEGWSTARPKHNLFEETKAEHILANSANPTEGAADQEEAAATEQRREALAKKDPLLAQGLELQKEAKKPGRAKK